MQKASLGRDHESANPFFQNKDIAALWRIPFFPEGDAVAMEKALRERIKELNCLYGVSQLAERNSRSIEKFLEELVRFLPYSWQFPELARARIIFRDKTFASADFAVTDWRQASQIYMYREPVGEVAIFYTSECPPADEGPFLKEERALLDSVAEQIGTVATRIYAELELQESNRLLTLERKALEEANTALRIVLSRIEQERQETNRDIQTNIDRVVKPILQSLASQLPKAQKDYVTLLEKSLDQIASPFVTRLSRSFESLTPTEIAICNMVRNGLRTKEIAALRGISEATVNRHREKIRRKLRLTNQDINLASFLQSAMSAPNL